jgi:hypothetical protein|tara:strand:- start:298 stop:483 length:186 start_codon:yes stop_codon:yes gene_type:complete
MADEAARFTAEQVVMDSNLEIGKLKHLIEVRDYKIKSLKKQLEVLDKSIKRCYNIVNAKEN